MGIKLEKSWNEYKTTDIAYNPTDFEEVIDVDGNNVLVKSRALHDGQYIVYVCHATGKPLTLDDTDFEIGSDWAASLIYGVDCYVYSKEYAEENMERCECCGKWIDISSDEGIITEEDSVFCYDCATAGRAYQCDECGNWHNTSHYDSDDCHYGGGMEGENKYGESMHICSNCREDYSYCNNCGCIIHADEAYYTDDGAYCENCYRPEEDNVLHSYHFDGDESDYDMPYLGESTRQVDPLLGVEAEMDKGGKDEEKIQSIKEALGEEYCVACEDGSLDDGFELISCPANLVSHQNKLEWGNAFDTALRFGYRGHDGGTCGLHVHIDRKFFNGSKLSSTEIEGAMFIVLKNNIDWIKKFSRRFSYNYCQINGEDDGVTIKDMGKYNEKWSNKEVYNRRDRYKAINFSRSDTIEFRIFRGTLNIETFYATLEFVDMFARLVKFCDSLEKAMEIDLYSFVDFAIRAYGYEDFVNYGMKIGIIDNNETGF